MSSPVSRTATHPSPKRKREVRSLGESAVDGVDVVDVGKDETRKSCAVAGCPILRGCLRRVGDGPRRVVPSLRCLLFTGVDRSPTLAPPFGGPRMGHPAELEFFSWCPLTRPVFGCIF